MKGNQNDKSGKDEFSFSYYGFDDEQQKKDQDKTEKSKPSTVPALVQSATSIKDDEKEKQKKQKRSAQEEFYMRVLQYQENLPREDVKIYKQNMEGYDRWSGISTLAFYGYMFYIVDGQDRKWWKLTTRPILLIPRAILLFLVPLNYFQGKMQRENYQFYRRNMATLEPLLTLQDRKEMKLADLLKKYQ